MEHLHVVYRESATNCAAVPKQEDPRWQSETAYCNDYRLNQDGQTSGEEDRRMSLEALCTSLQGLLSDPSTHFTAIDAKLSENFLFYPRASRLDPIINEDQAIQAASQLLSRLPVAPPKIELAYHVWGSSSSNLHYLEKYCSCRLQHNDSDRLVKSHPSPWTELVVVSKISTVVARLALLIVTTGDDRFNVGSAIRNFIDLISELIETTERMKMATDRYAIAEHSILQVFFGLFGKDL